MRKSLAVGKLCLYPPSFPPTTSRTALCPRREKAAHWLGGYADKTAAEDRETDVVILLKA